MVGTSSRSPAGLPFFFGLEPPTSVLGDMNTSLMDAYAGVVSHTDDVIRRLRAFRRRHRIQGDSFYYHMRRRWNRAGWKAFPAARAAAFVYLNKTCFNGVWRVNRAGEMNTPVGTYDDPRIVDVAGLRAAARVLAGTELRVGGYKETTRDVRSGDFVYLDPPYDPISPTSNFTGYTRDGFDFSSQEALAAHARALRAIGAYVLLSNNDTPRVRSLYHGFKIEHVRCSRSINCKVARRGKVGEIIITGEP